MPSGRGAHRRPRPARRPRPRGRCAAACASGASSGWNTTCTTPSRSRRSMKVTPPWSRRCATQPQSVTSSPAWSSRSSPHACVRIVVAQRSTSCAARPPSPSSLASQSTTSSSGTVFCTPSTSRRSVTAPVRELPLPDDRRERGAGAVRHLELRLQRPLLERARRPATPARAQRRRPGARPAPRGLVAERDHEAPSARGRAARRALALHREQHAVEPHREPDPGRRRARRAPRRGRRSARRAFTVPPPCSPRERAGDPLERRARVVVEPAHQAGSSS